MEAGTAWKDGFWKREKGEWTSVDVETMFRIGPIHHTCDTCGTKESMLIEFPNPLSGSKEPLKIIPVPQEGPKIEVSEPKEGMEGL